MRSILFLLVVVFLVAAGCNPEGDNIYNTYHNYYPEDSTSIPDTSEDYRVHITYPDRYEVLEIEYNWIQRENPNNYSCQWGYHADTTIYAEVTTNILEPVIEARVFIQNYPGGNFSQYGGDIYPGENPFSIRIYDVNISFSQNTMQDQELAFWVSVTTEDSTNYISPTIPFKIVKKINYDMDVPPLAPVADTLTESTYQQQMYIEWCAQSPNADSFHVSVRAGASGQIARFTVPGSQNELHTNRYAPLTTHSVWITAVNPYGESAASDTMYLTTSEPYPPEDLRAMIYADSRVTISWSNRSYPDSIAISRRDTLSDWSTIETLGCTSYCPSNFDDTTIVAQTVYYYRIGCQFTNGIWWSQDSIGVWIP